MGLARGERVNGSAVMPDPAAGNWGLTSLTGFLEGSVLNVFASGPAEKVEGAGEGGRGGAGGSSAAGAMQVQKTSKPLPGVGLPQQLCGDAASSKPGRTTSTASLESDLPELGRLERTKTPVTSVPTSDEEPACRGAGGGSSGEVRSFEKSIHKHTKPKKKQSKKSTHSFPVSVRRMLIWIFSGVVVHTIEFK